MAVSHYDDEMSPCCADEFNGEAALPRQTGQHQRRKQGLVEKLVAQTAVEAFDEGVLHRLAWRDVMPLDRGLAGPCQDGVAGEFAAIVADRALKRTASGRGDNSGSSSVRLSFGTQNLNAN